VPVLAIIQIEKLAIPLLIHMFSTIWSPTKKRGEGGMSRFYLGRGEQLLDLLDFTPVI
jgi:hypothetical protein